MAPPAFRAKAAELSQPVRGRNIELTVLGEHLDHLLSGVGTVVLVEGEAGMGKSRLLDEVAAMARRLSIRVGVGVADPGDSVVHLSALMEAFSLALRRFLRRAGLLDAHTSLERRYWLLQDLKEALLEWAALEAPPLVRLDDLQWTESSTAAALRALRPPGDGAGGLGGRFSPGSGITGDPDRDGPVGGMSR